MTISIYDNRKTGCREVWDGSINLYNMVARKDERPPFGHYPDHPDNAPKPLDPFRGEGIAMCPAGCGCLWRLNEGGDSVSLFGANSKSCEVCEPMTWSQYLPVTVGKAPHTEPRKPRVVFCCIEGDGRIFMFETKADADVFGHADAVKFYEATPEVSAALAAKGLLP